jgi:hypothetical protein
MIQTRFYPRGNALTENVSFTDRDDVQWLVYVEGFPLAQQSWGRARLPERRLRFDSAFDSRATSLLPAGAPFLRGDQLQSLLDSAGAVVR